MCAPAEVNVQAGSRNTAGTVARAAEFGDA